MIKIIQYSVSLPKETLVIDTTSRSKNWSKGLSPFYLGPVFLYENYFAKNVENGWQYTKLYSQHADENGQPTEKYWEWAKSGWNKDWADRYPMGKGAKPLCSLWKGNKLDYIEARKQIYIPLYSETVKNTDAFKQLEDIFNQCNLENRDLYLRDFDGYDSGLKSWDTIINDPKKKMGHAFVLAMLLEKAI